MNDSPSISLEFPHVMATAWTGRIFTNGSSYNKHLLTCPHPDRYVDRNGICWRCCTVTLWRAR